MKTPAYPSLAFEKALWKKGITLVAGIDEAGRGAWAGPVAAAAVVLPSEKGILKQLLGVRDSKQMSAHQRVVWAECIQQVARFWAVGFATREEIDTLGILPATRLAMYRAVLQLGQTPQHLLIDAVVLKDLDISQTSLIKGDCQVLSIAAASVLAKTARDALMCNLDLQYPAYGFASHKGYGTRRHQQALTLHGACPLHRTSYAPIAKIIGEIKHA